MSPASRYVGMGLRYVGMGMPSEQVCGFWRRVG